MTSAEKRAELGADWPACECHGQPMVWRKQDALRDGGQFLCRIRKRYLAKRGREIRKARGQCAQCTAPLATETLCQKHADAHADLMAGPKQKLDHQLAQIRYRNGQRITEVFHPTSDGMAVIAAWLQEGPGHGPIQGEG